MGSFRIGENGEVTVTPGTNTNITETATETYTQGGSQTAPITREAGDIEYSVPFNAGGVPFTQQPSAPVPVGEIAGVTYYDQASYDQAKSNIVQRQRDINRGIRGNIRKVQGAESEPAAMPMSMATQAGLAPMTVDQVSQSERKDEGKTAEKPASSVPSVSSSDVVADADEPLESQPATASENLGYVDPDTGVIESLTPERANVRAFRKRGRKRGRKSKTVAPKSKIAEYIRRMDEEAADGSHTYYIPPSAFDQIDSHDNLVLRDALDHWVDPTPEEIATAKAQREWYTRRQAERNRINAISADNVAEYYDRKRAALDRIGGDNRRYMAREVAGLDDVGYGSGTYTDLGDLDDYGEDLDDAKAQEKMRRRMVKSQTSRSGNFFEIMAENKTDMTGRGLDDKRDGQRPWAEEETSILKRLSEARDEIKLRLLNPMKLRIESEHIETKIEKNGKKRTVKGRLRYSQVVENAIHNVKDRYKCTTRDVMALVQLRAGLGVGIGGRIGKKKADKFVLTDAQFEEICKDIIRSQELYGHPMALVDGIPGLQHVRDDSGKFVVVSGTRCFPLGYVPTYLLANLSADPDSDLYGVPIGQTARLIGNSWINETYPALMANSDGNLLWQTRAIENMMRAVVSMDGNIPGVLRKLGVPDLEINKSMMQMCAERAQAGDEAMIRSMEERKRREERHNEVFRQRNMRMKGRDQDSKEINSPARRRWASGDVLRGVSSMAKGAKAADFFLLVTSPLEAVQALGEQHVGDAILQYGFDKLHPGVREQFTVTSKMKNAATSRQGVEARTVLEALHRIGGWVAIDAFLGEKDGDGRAKYRLTNADMRRFLADFGYSGESIPDRLMQAMGIEPKQAPAFVTNVKGALEFLEDTMLCSNMFKVHEADQFVKLSMMEMARSSVRNDESYTSADVEQWSNIGAEEMMRQLIRTNAGREAFMTQGITSLGRKSPMDYAIRRVMAKNGLIELLIRTNFDRFPEYGMNKVMRQIPASNTLSYLGSWGIDSIGSFIGILNSNNRVGRYQVGGTYYGAGGINRGFFEGLVKNLIYDSVMAANRITISTIYWGMLQVFGGVRRPPREKDLYTWSEWIIGGEDDEYATPIKWAWFMDDISGIGFPLGVAWAIMSSESNTTNPFDWTPESKDLATKVFMNAVANFNDGTALFDALDLFNNWDAEANDAIHGDGIGMWLNPNLNELNQTTFELGVWKFVGDMTPSLVKQLLPWSRDYLFRGNDPYARTASKVYANRNRENGNGDYSMDEAIAQYRVRSVDDYNEYRMRLEAQNNPVMAMIKDITERAGFFSDEDNEKTGYAFVEQPYATEVDKVAKLQWDKYSLDENKLSKNPDEAKEQCRAHAEWICKEIDANFENPSDALEKGFCMNPTARRACQEYCQWMINVHINEMRDLRIDEMKEEIGGRLESDVYQGVVDTYDDMKEHYRMLYDNYFSGDADIPWRLPRYRILDSDIETRYVDENGNAAVNPYFAWAANRLGMDVTAGTPEMYSYGNRPVSWPYFVPERTLGFANETEPYLVRRDEEGNVTSDTQGLYDMLGDFQAPPGATEEEAEKLREEALAVRDQLYGDRGRDAVPTVGRRGLEAYDTSMPEGFNPYYDSESASKELGFPAFDKQKAKEEERLKKLEDKIDELQDMLKNGGYNWRYNGGRRYYSGGYRRYYGGGGGGSSSYNPKIYSNAKNVYSQRASGMSTHQPYRASTSYLRPSFSMSGSRKSNKRQY